MLSVPVVRPALAALIAVTPLSAYAQRHPMQGDSAAQAPLPPPPYALFADLVLAAPVVVDATIRGTTRIKGPEAATVAPGHVRFYVEADVRALIRGSAALPPRIGYLLDVPLDSRGRAPGMRKLHVLLFARAVPGQSAQIQLVRPDAQKRWTPAADDLVRRIVRDVLAPDAPPEVTGVGNAFHVPGTLPGDGETQIFLTTKDNRPVSLAVSRSAGRPPQWSVALSEIVDQAAPPPPPDTLLWYRLACALPPALPDASTDSATPENAAIAREDYAFVLQSLGRCVR